MLAAHPWFVMVVVLFFVLQAFDIDYYFIVKISNAMAVVLLFVLQAIDDPHLTNSSLSLTQAIVHFCVLLTIICDGASSPFAHCPLTHVLQVAADTSSSK